MAFFYPKLRTLLYTIGPKEYDVARTYVLLTENNPAAKAVEKKYLELMEMSFLQIEAFLGAIQFCQ